jgi:hypothetical protein
MEKLWLSHSLSSGSSELTRQEELENDARVLTFDLQEAIAKLYVNFSSGPTVADISNWLAGGVKENLQIMTYQEMINNALEDNNSENEQESSTPLNIRTIQHDDAMSALNTCYK